MVYFKQKFKKIVICIFLTSFFAQTISLSAFAQVYTTRPFTVFWLGEHQELCTRLAKSFIQELEAFLPDRDVLLNPQNNNSEISKESIEEKDSIFLRCDPQSKDTLVIEDPRNLRASIDMRYLEKLDGFEHSAWLELQKNYLRVQKDIALEDLAPKKLSEKTEVISGVQKIESNLSEPAYKKWWFWPVIGAVAIGIGTGIYFMNQSHSSSTVKVDIK